MKKISNRVEFGSIAQALCIQDSVQVSAGEHQKMELRLLKFGEQADQEHRCAAAAAALLETPEHMLNEQYQ
jgi:hypothetical protein